jgi:recombinational DNA repair protein (RecF pathway)
MQRDRSTRDPARLELKRCSACAEVKRVEDFYVSRGRLSSYCKDCQRQASRRAYRRRRQDPAAHAQMRSVDRLRKRQERARLAQLDPKRERQFGRARRSATRRLIAAHEREYRALLQEEREAAFAFPSDQHRRKGAEGGDAA